MIAIHGQCKYNAHGHKWLSPVSEKAQFATAPAVAKCLSSSSLNMNERTRKWTAKAVCFYQDFRLFAKFGASMH
jgi:hypothetical protein